MQRLAEVLTLCGSLNGPHIRIRLTPGDNKGNSWHNRTELIANVPTIEWGCVAGIPLGMTHFP